jgi:hypothetical protein
LDGGGHPADCPVQFARLADEYLFPPVLQEVLQGMLHPSGKERWTAQQAIMTLSQADLDGVGSLKGAWVGAERSKENGGRGGHGDKSLGRSSAPPRPSPLCLLC